MVVKQLAGTVALAMGVMVSGGPTSSPRIRTQFLSGAPAPAGLTFASFGRAAMNARGTVCFLAGWDGLRHRPEGLFLKQGDQVIPIARAGDLIPGSAGDRFSFPPDYPDDFTSFSLNNKDNVAFIVRQGLFFYSGGTVRPVARVGAEVPGVPDERWDAIDSVSLNSAGALAFTGAIRSVQDGDRQEGMFLASGDSINIILFDGDQPADLDGALNSFASVSLADSGEMATLATEGDDSLGCLLLTIGSETRALAVEGKPAPGGVWSNLGSVALNNHHVIAFQARVTNDSGEHSGIFQASSGVVTPVALPGQAVGPNGSDVLGDSVGRPVIDAEGDVTFLTNRSGSSPAQALIMAREGRLSALAAEGLPAPGSTGGTITRFSGLNLGSMSPAGLVCGVSVTGGSVSDSLVQYPAQGSPEVLLTTDAALPPGAVLTLEDGETPSREVQARINRSGELVFAAHVGGYGRALFRVGASGLELLTPLGHSHTGAFPLRSVVSFDMNDAGQVAFLGTQDEADQGLAVLTTDVHEQRVTRAVATTGNAIPGAPDRMLNRLGLPVIDGSGAVLFAGTSRGTSLPASANRSYLLRASATGLETLLGEGQRVEGAGTLMGLPDADPAALLFRDLQVNPEGQALFKSSYQDEKTGAFGPAGLFLVARGMVRAVALPGQSAPLPGPPVYTGFSAPRLSDNGSVVFAATVAGAGRKPRSGLFRWSATGAITLAASGDPVPGLNGEQYRAMLDPVSSAAGDVAFLALLDPPPANGSPDALLIATGLATRAALMDGDPVDAQGSLVVSLNDSLPAAPLALLDDGSLLVAAHLRGAPGAPSDGSLAPDGLFLVQPN